MAFIQRTGEATILRSEKLPAVAIQIDPAFRYVGATSFILYDIARVEQHHFVMADANRQVEKLLWFQFEGYLKDNDRRYRYPSSIETITIGGLTFLHDEDVLNIEAEYRERPTSDSAHVMDFLKEKGFTLEGDVMFKRLVWLDADLRNELMIIYAEARAVEGELARALQDRALSSFEIL